MVPGAAGAKRRFLWTEDLHKRFLAAIFDIGLSTATPKQLLEALMNDGGAGDMTTDHIKSHLQKYRNNSGASRNLFLAGYAAARREADARAAAQTAAGGTAFPTQFSTYPGAPPAQFTADGAFVPPPSSASLPGCPRCGELDTMMALGIAVAPVDPEREREAAAAAAAAATAAAGLSRGRSTDDAGGVPPGSLSAERTAVLLARLASAGSGGGGLDADNDGGGSGGGGGGSGGGGSGGGDGFSRHDAIELAVQLLQAAGAGRRTGDGASVRSRTTSTDSGMAPDEWGQLAERQSAIARQMEAQMRMHRTMRMRQGDSLLQFTTGAADAATLANALVASARAAAAAAASAAETMRSVSATAAGSPAGGLPTAPPSPPVSLATPLGVPLPPSLLRDPTAVASAVPVSRGYPSGEPADVLRALDAYMALDGLPYPAAARPGAYDSDASDDEAAAGSGGGGTGGGGTGGGVSSTNGTPAPTLAARSPLPLPPDPTAALPTFSSRARVAKAALAPAAGLFSFLGVA